MKNIDEKMKKVNSTLENVFNFLFMFLLVLLMVGSCMDSHREQAAFGLLILALGWVMSKILQEGIKATTSLFFTKKIEDDTDNHNKED